jgi:hypothetical protein
MMKMQINVAPPSALRADTNGYCYLHFFQSAFQAAAAERLGELPGRAMVEAYGNRNSQRLDRSKFFRMTVSRPPGYTIYRFVLHVEPVNAHISAMTFEECMAAAPFASKFGADQLPAHHAPVTSVVPSAPVELADSRVRRFFVPAGALIYSRNAQHTNKDVRESAPIPAWAKWHSQVTFTSLRAHLVPTAHAGKVQTTLSYCWAHENVAGVSGSSDGTYAVDQPSFQVVAFGPPAAGGAVPTQIITCPFGLNLSHQAKPTPTFGGSPVLYLHWKTSVLGADEPTTYAAATDKEKAIAADDLFSLWFEVELDARPRPTA